MRLSSGSVAKLHPSIVALAATFCCGARWCKSAWRRSIAAKATFSKPRPCILTRYQATQAPTQINGMSE
jgi:hypothetical protein